MITYRELLQSDIPAVIEMWKNTNGVRLHENGEDSEDGISLCIGRNSGLSMIAAENDSIIGAVLSGQDGRRGYIYHLAVAQEYRRQGIATQLLRLTEQKMREAEIHKLALFVLNDNEEAQAFYKKIGWHEENIVKIFSEVI